MSKTVTIYDGKGNEVSLPSIAKAAKELGVCESILHKRIRDGHWIHRKNGEVPVRVRVQ